MASLPPTHILPTPHSGLGVFALSPIPAGTLIHTSTPILLISGAPSTITPSRISAAISTLNPEELTAFHELSAPETHHSTLEARIFFGNGMACYPPSTTTGTSDNPGGAVTRNQEATCLSPTAARFNHSCRPNATLSFSYSHPPNTPTTTTTAPSHIHINLHALHPIPLGAEITFTYLSYISAMPRSYRRFLLYLNWSFTCACPACIPHSPESDTRRESIYAIRARLQPGFSLPILSTKAIVKMGVPLKEVWPRVGELQGVLGGLWLPPQVLGWEGGGEAGMEESREEMQGRLAVLLREEGLS